MKEYLLSDANKLTDGSIAICEAEDEALAVRTLSRQIGKQLSLEANDELPDYLIAVREIGDYFVPKGTIGVWLVSN